MTLVYFSKHTKGSATTYPVGWIHESNRSHWLHSWDHSGQNPWSIHCLCTKPGNNWSMESFSTRASAVFGINSGNFRFLNEICVRWSAFQHGQSKQNLVNHWGATNCNPRSSPRDASRGPFKTSPPCAHVLVVLDAQGALRATFRKPSVKPGWWILHCRSTTYKNVNT